MKPYLKTELAIGLSPKQKNPWRSRKPTTLWFLTAQPFSIQWLLRWASQIHPVAILSPAWKPTNQLYCDIYFDPAATYS